MKAYDKSNSSNEFNVRLMQPGDDMTKLYHWLVPRGNWSGRTSSLKNS